MSEEPQRMAHFTEGFVHNENVTVKYTCPRASLLRAGQSDNRHRIIQFDTIDYGTEEPRQRVL
jgi:hypothetical protein